MKISVCAILAIGVVYCVCGSTILSNAVSQLAANQQVCTRRVIVQADEFGLPTRFCQTDAFKNLLRIVSNQLNDCSMQYVRSLTNRFERSLLISAAARCGAEAYGDFLDRIFVLNTNVIQNAEIASDYVNALGTELEDYPAMHYDESKMRNVLLAYKAICQRCGDTNKVSVIENEYLTGKHKLFVNELRAAEAL